MASTKKKGPKPRMAGQLAVGFTADQWEHLATIANAEHEGVLARAVRGLIEEALETRRLTSDLVAPRRRRRAA